MAKQYETRDVQQKVNNGDGTQTVITVTERRLKKAHDKLMSRLHSRQRGAAAEQHAAVESHFEPSAVSPKVESAAAEELPTED
jgi:hypothetical protein